MIKQIQKFFCKEDTITFTMHFMKRARNHFPTRGVHEIAYDCLRNKDRIQFIDGINNIMGVLGRYPCNNGIVLTIIPYKHNR